MYRQESTKVKKTHNIKNHVRPLKRPKTVKNTHYIEHKYPQVKTATFSAPNVRFADRPLCQHPSLRLWRLHCVIGVLTSAGEKVHSTGAWTKMVILDFDYYSVSELQRHQSKSVKNMSIFSYSIFCIQSNDPIQKMAGSLLD